MSRRVNTQNLTCKTAGKQIFLLALPYLLAFAAICCFAFCASSLLGQVLQNSVFASLFKAPELVEQTENHIDQVTIGGNTASIDDMPILSWGDRWATISVDELPDASIQDAPVFVGDSDDLLKKGVCKYYGSYFCGEGGKIVLSAHCNKQFYCLEDMQIGYTVRMHTVYGEYVYRVDEIFLFEVGDDHVVLDDSEQEELLLYTCYPRGLGYRRQRLGLRCSKVSGVDFR